jgi:hypothetical protein
MARLHQSRDWRSAPRALLRVKPLRQKQGQLLLSLAAPPVFLLAQ